MRMDIGIILYRVTFFQTSMRGLVNLALLALFFGTLAVAGCGKQDLSTPPKIVYGRDVCAQCRMIIQDERFACAAVSADGRSLKFDDIGCMAAFTKENGPALRGWVHDANDTSWIAKEKARFVYSRGLVTPMGYGLAAFVNAKDAALFAKEKTGRLITWDELTDLTNKEIDLNKGGR